MNWLLVSVAVAFVFSAGFVAGCVWGSMHAYRDGYGDGMRAYHRGGPLG